MARGRTYTGNECAFCGEVRREVLVEVPLKEAVVYYCNDVLVCRNCLWLIDNLQR